VCSNGFASFTSTADDYLNDPIPYASEPNNLIAPYWDDFNPYITGSVWYYDDTANDRFVVEWYQVPHYGTGGSYTFQLILNSDHTIDYLYHTLQHGTANSSTVGIENAAGDDGLLCVYNGSGLLVPEAGTAIRIPTVRLALEPVDDLVISQSGDNVELSWSPAQCAHAYYVYKSTTGPEGVYNFIGFTPATSYIDTDAISANNASFYYVTGDDDPTDAGIVLSIFPFRSRSPAVQIKK
jgi:hypothetical protein